MAGNRIFIVYDTEGTGLNKMALTDFNVPAAITVRGSEVCQIGGIVLDERMVPLKFFCHYCDIVSADSPPSAKNVHGIHMRDVRQTLLTQFLPEVMLTHLPEFFQEDVIFIGYNIEFDMTLVAQTLANSPFPFSWTPFKGTILPKHGRYSVNVADYVKQGSHYRKLSSFEEELSEARRTFIFRFVDRLAVETNNYEMLKDTWEHAHNSFFDAVNTLLLWGDKVWRKKLL